MLHISIMRPTFWIFLCVIYYGHSAARVRIPKNPCPNTFRYFKTSEDGEIYGEIQIPYDGLDNLELNVNASFADHLPKAKLKIQLVTPVTELATTNQLTYQIFFPSQTVIPKITELKYNGRIYCSGPPEPLIAGTPGVTNLWAGHTFSYTSPMSEGSKKYEATGIVDEHQLDNNYNNQPEVKPISFVGSSVAPEAKTTTTTPLAKLVTTNSKSAVNNQCGISNGVAVPLIYGGTETVAGQYPWLVALFAYNPRSTGYEYKCSANLISDMHVITAGRCIQYYQVQVVATEDILIVMGTNDLAHWATNGAVAREAIKVQTHPDFTKNPDSAHADIAVVTLNKPVTFSNRIRPVCLWNNINPSLDPFVNKMGTIAGWGKDKNTNTALNVPKSRYSDIPIVSQFECLKSDVSIRHVTSDKTFCAGDKTGKGPCIGDSGSGYVVPINGKYHLRGIASLTLSKNGTCDLENKYAVFCDVAKLMDWVKTCINET